MSILNPQQRADLRDFFDHDKNNVFEILIKTIKLKLRERSGIGSTEYETLLLTISRDSKIEAMDDLLEVLNQELADQEVDNA